MSREIFSHEVASPHKRQSEKGDRMDKSQKMRGCVALLEVSRNNLNEVKETLLNELKNLFRALEIQDQDFEKIEDPQLYSIALDLDYNAHEIAEKVEELESLIIDLDKLNV